MIIRIYDAFDRRSKATLTVNGDFKRAHLCDMLENTIEALPYEHNQLVIPVSNFEIVTIKLI